MFETTVVESREHHTRAASIGAFPVALSLHLVFVGGLMVADLWEQAFPLWPPGVMSSYQVLETVAPSPPPAPPELKEEPPGPAEIVPDSVAPTFVPDVIPELEPPEPLVFASVIGDLGGVEGAVGSGAVGGVIGGLIGGVISAAPPVDTIVVPRDAALPVKALTTPYPSYPEKWRWESVEDDVVLRYTIDKKGRVSAVEIIVPARFEEFDKASLRAVKSWRFTPLVVNGVKTRVVHELTIHYRILQRVQRREREARKESRKRKRGSSGFR